MRRIPRLILPLLFLSLSVTGQAEPCAHEHPEAEPATAATAGVHLHAGHEPAQPERAPCDDSSGGCCEALAPCAISVALERASRERAQPRLVVTRIARTEEILPASAPHEVATPPPRA